MIEPKTAPAPGVAQNRIVDMALHLSTSSASLRALATSLLLAASIASPLAARGADGEYTGKFEPKLVADPDARDQVVFSQARGALKLKLAKPVDDGSAVSVGWLFDPRTEKSAIQALLV